jgi:hypothetical protein
MPVPRFRSRARLSVQLLEGRDVPNGTITASLSPTGVLTLTGDDDDNTVSLQLNSGTSVVLTPDGATQINTAAVGNAVTLNGTVKSIKANLLGGADTVSIDGAADFIVPGSVSLNLGDGNNTLNLTTTGKITLTGLTVTGGDGLDTINVSGGTGSTIGGTAKFTLGNGGTVTNLTGVGFSGVSFTAGEAAGDGVTEPTNSVVGTNLTVTKTFTAGLGNGNPSALDFTGSTLGGLKVSGTSVVSSLTTTQVNGSVAYKATFGVAVLGNGLTVTGNVGVTAANASFGAIDVGAVTISGNLSVTGSLVTTTDFESTAPSEVKGNLTVKGGLGNDEFIASSAFKADKNFTLSLGGGNNTVSIGDGSAVLSIGGKGSITTGDGIDSVSFSDVSWGGPITLSLKGGGDLLSIDDGTAFHSTFTADTGAGDDTISIAQDTGSTAPVTFTGKAKITAGTGNDSLFLGLAQLTGGDANSKAVFSDPTSVVDGGLGLNFFDSTSAQFTGVAPVNWQ